MGVDECCAKKLQLLNDGELTKLVEFGENSVADLLGEKEMQLRVHAEEAIVKKCC